MKPPIHSFQLFPCPGLGGGTPSYSGVLTYTWFQAQEQGVSSRGPLAASRAREGMTFWLLLELRL